MKRRQKVGNVQINEDVEFQKRSWVIQRVGWVIFTLVLLLACLGLFGNGPLSEAKAGQMNGPLWVEYPRFAGLEAEFPILVHADSGMASDGKLMIHLDSNYLDRIEVNDISPDPEAEIYDGDRITYVFNTSSTNSPFRAYFYLTPKKFGIQAGTFQLQNGETVYFSQFIYP